MAERLICSAIAGRERAISSGRSLTRRRRSFGMREVILRGGTDQARVLNERRFGSDRSTNFTVTVRICLPILATLC